jgi:alkylhydroperoxidase family enzyme
MARIPYANSDQCEELIRAIRLPEDTAPNNAVRILAHAPAIGGSVLRLIHTILAKADLDFCLRELAILRVAWRCEAQYAWVQHVAIARSIGVSDEQISALEGSDVMNGPFSWREQIRLAFTDEVLDGPAVSDFTFARAREEFSIRELVELLLTIGYFRMIGPLLTTLEVDPEAPRSTEWLELANRMT